jgi:CRP-like cAMP-binding protein
VTVDGIGQIALLQQGEIVGEMSFVDDGLPSATVSCLNAATLLAIDRRDMGDRLAADAGFAARFYRAMAMFLSDRLRIANGGTRDDADELSEAALQTLSNAGQRFDTLRRLALEREGAS